MYFTSFPFLRVHKHQKNEKFQIFPFKCTWNQNWPCRKIGQGKPRVMSYINFVVRQTLMLHARSSRQLAKWFCRRRFFKVLSISEHGGHFGHMTWIIYINFRSPFPRRLHIKFGFDRPGSFRREDFWKVWTQTDDDDDGRQTMGIL